MGVFQPATREGFPAERLGTAENTGNQPDHRIQKSHGGYLTAGQHVIAQGYFPRMQSGADPFINAFVVTAEQDQALLFGQFARDRLGVRLARGRQEDQLRIAPSMFPKVLHGSEDRLGTDHHAGAAPVGRGVHFPVLRIRAEIAQIEQTDIRQPLLERDFEDAFLQHPLEHPGEERDDVDFHGFLGTLPAEGRQFYRCGTGSQG